jgi:biopolymer transport protein ExbD
MRTFKVDLKMVCRKTVSRFIVITNEQTFDSISSSHIFFDYGNKKLSHLIIKPFIMAEITIKNQPHNGKRSIKKSTNIDLTPMVDLGFLLITFFVFTTTMATPTSMQINTPFDKTPTRDQLKASCVLTVLLEKNNEIKYYEGLSTEINKPMTTFFGKDGIRKVIMAKRQEVQKRTGNADNFVLIIKATDKSSFQNFVDMVDETTICCVKHYYTAVLDENDNRLLTTN